MILIYLKETLAAELKMSLSNLILDKLHKIHLSKKGLSDYEITNSESQKNNYMIIIIPKFNNNSLGGSIISISDT